ncbi:MAG: Ig-like domain-containing protein [bacterium]|nr:Ig-like domain-containing protein [bacterium]
MRTTIYSSLILLILAGLLSCGDVSIPGSPNPLSVGITPSNDAVGVARDVVAIVSFGEPMNEDSVIAKSSFRNIDDDVAVPYTLTWNTGMSVATYRPDSPLEYDTSYRMRVEAFVESLDGSVLRETESSIFTTIPHRPAVVGTVPYDEEQSVETTTRVDITFNSSWLDRDTFEGNLTVTPTTAFNLSMFDEVVYLSFATHYLELDTWYTIELETGIADEFGQTMEAPYSFSFRTTDGVVDEDPPVILRCEPAHGAIGVAQDFGELRIIFDEEIDPTTFSIQTLDYRLLNCGFSEPVWEEGNTVALFEIADLPAGVDLVAVIGPCDDVAGNTSEAPTEWSFSTTGEAVYTPHGASDWWNYKLGGDDPVASDCLEKVEEVNSYIWYQTRLIEPIGGRVWNPEDYTQGIFQKRLIEMGNVIQWQRWNNAPPDGAEISCSPNITLLNHPLDLDKTWGTSSGFNEEGVDYQMSHTFTVQAIEDLTPTVLPPEIDLPEAPELVLPYCVLVRGDYEIRYWQSATVVETRVDSTWYCPGVGVVKVRDYRTPYVAGNPEETTLSTYDLLRWNVMP